MIFHHDRCPARRFYARPTETLGLARPIHLGFVRTGWGRFVNADAVPAILDLEDVTHVLVDEDGGFADGGTALAGFCEACLEAGVAVSLYSTVVDFLRAGERVTGVVFDRWSRMGSPKRGTRSESPPPAGANSR